MTILSALVRLAARTVEVVFLGGALLIGTAGVALVGIVLVAGGLTEGGDDAPWIVFVGLVMLAGGLVGTWSFGRAVLGHWRDRREWREQAHGADEPPPPGFFDL